MPLNNARRLLDEFRALPAETAWLDWWPSRYM
jgi:hypothetical protein